MERLYKSRDDKVFDGVCGGVAQYFNIDPVIIRLLWLVLVVFGGTGVLAYLVAMIIIPKAPGDEITEDKANDSESISNRFWGLLLTVIGFLLLFGILVPLGGIFAGLAFFMGSIFCPVLVIALGLYLFFKQTDNKTIKASIDEVFPPGEKLFRSRTDNKIAGICGGIGAYFKIDSNIIRIFWVMATLGSFGLGVIAYIVLAIYLQEAE